MRNLHDKRVIEHWLRLYERLTGSSYKVTAWPDSDSTKENVDARCVDATGLEMAIEHTLIEPFQKERADAARFERTLAALENDSTLCLQGYTYIVSQEAGAIPSGIPWAEVKECLRNKLAASLPNMPEGRSTISVEVGKFSLDIRVRKTKTSSGEPGKLLTGRVDPGSPGPKLMRDALERKIPKLAASVADKRILLLEKDSVAGTIEDQYDKVREETKIQTLRSGISEIWCVNTVCLVSEHVIFTNLIDPLEDDNRSFCSLNIETGEFWQVPH